MEKWASTRRHWRIAVTVSVLLHGAAVLGLALLPGRTFVEARSASSSRLIPFICDDGDTGEITFEEPRASGGGKKPNTHPALRTAPSPEDTGIARAGLRDPLAASTGEESSSQSSEPGQGGSAGNGTASFFQVEARGRRIVYVVDASASMGKNGALAAACRELQESVKKLPAAARFQIIVYNSQARFLLPQVPDWRAPTPASVREVGEALAQLVAEGRTEHGPALQKAFLLRPDVVFFLTDADDLTAEHLRLVSQLNKSHAVVHTIELNTRNRDRTEMPLQVLARENHGLYQAVDLEH